MKLISIILLFLITMSNLHAQNNFGEILPEDFEQSTIFTQKDNIDIIKLPKSVDLSLKIPPAGNQNPRGTCWAFASTYGLISFLYNTKKQDNYFLLDNGEPDYSKIKSPEIPVQLYFEGKKDCDVGATSKDMLKITLQEYGNLAWNEIPYSHLCSKTLSLNIKSKAKKNILSNYDVEVIRGIDLITMKQILANGQPLLISISVDDNFSNIARNVQGNYQPLWNEYGYNKGGHAMVIVGYDDSVSAVKVLNSWGADWGNNGYLWISYKILNNHARYYCYPINRGLVKKVNPKNNETSEILQYKDQYTLSTWAKEGYYRVFNGLRVGIASLDENKGFAIIDIRDNKGALLTNFYIDKNTTKNFYIDNIQYSFKFDNIGQEGRNFLKKAVFFTINKIIDR